MKRLYCVTTKVTLTYEKLTLIRKKKKLEYMDYFTYNTRIIYASSINDARDKYVERYMYHLERIDNKVLNHMLFNYDDCSKTMQWVIPKFTKVTYNESVHVYAQPVNIKIKTLMDELDATDFRDWWNENNTIEGELNHEIEI